jgi:hypothetical protein
MSYESTIEKLLTGSSRRDYLRQLPGLLGCRHLTESRNDEDWHLVEPDQPDADKEPVAQRALLTMLGSLTEDDWFGFDELYVLDGLCQNERWKKCLQSEKLTYAFAALVLRFSHKKVRNEGVLTGAMAHDVEAMLYAWTDIHSAAERLHSMPNVARAMFGSIWWEMSIDEDLDFKLKLIHLVIDTRPSFLPGLIPVAMLPAEETLPVLAECT